MPSPDSQGRPPDPDIDPDAPLRRAADLVLRPQSDGSTRIESGDREHRFGPHALRILDVFARPNTLREALAGLQFQGAQDWIDLNDTIRKMCGAGVLEPADRPTTDRSQPIGFDAPADHVSMLNDRIRTATYLEAIAEVVKPGDVVAEIGTGTGVLAVAAARAGARRVYAIEGGRIGETARAVFEANGLEDRITLVSGWSTQVTLPERADVLVSEIIGDEPLHERVLQATRDAVQRFLKRDARFVPRRIRIYALAVSLPESVVSRYRFTESSQAQWSEWYGMDFGALASGNPAVPLRVYAQPLRAREWERLSEPALLAEIDLADAVSPGVEGACRAAALRAGEANGIVEYFELELSPRVTLSLDPARASQRSSWHLPVELLPEPIEVKEGEPVVFAYSYQAGRRRVLSLTRER